MLKIYGDKQSGNCLKILYLCQCLDLDFEWIDVDIMAGESRTEQFLARNPAGQIPLLELDEGRYLSQSNAILLYLARDSDFVPQDAWALAQVQQWLFWEQYSHEPNIAVCRFDKVYLGKSDAELDANKVAKGNAALDLMNTHLQHRDWLATERCSVADIALLAYTRLAHEGGFDVQKKIPIQHWINRTEQVLNLSV